MLPRNGASAPRALRRSAFQTRTDVHTLGKREPMRPGENCPHAGGCRV